jgi:hypothetical protein
VRGQMVALERLVLYAAQSWRRVSSSVENMWRGVDKRM